MSGKTVFTSHFNMHCFSCDSPIKKGEQITRCIETIDSNPKNLRNQRNNARWVHVYCVPKDVDTEFYREMIVDLMDYYQDMDENEAEFLVEEHDYWVHQEGAEFHEIETITKHPHLLWSRPLQNNHTQNYKNKT